MNRLAIIVIAQSVVCVVLVISLCWNIQQASEASARGQALYKIGLRDGETFARTQIARAEAIEELLADQRAKLAREKL